MSHTNNMDLRNTGDGGWFYAENELFSVFAPLIGPDGVVVYMAMCRLIPLAAVDPDRPVTVKRVEMTSCVSYSQAHRKMQQIVALGMVEETRSSRQRPSTYKLVQLRELARLGDVELQRRLGVSSGDTEPRPQASPRLVQTLAAATEVQSGAASVTVPPSLAGLVLAKAPMASVEAGVSPGDTDTETGQNQPVSQKTASVSQNWPSVSQKTALVSQNRGLLKEEEEDKEEDSPQPPQAGAADLPFADCKPGYQLFTGELRRAAHWVRRECGIHQERLERVIAAALLDRCQANGERLHEVARLAVQRYGEYQRDVALLRFQWGAGKFFGERHWQDQAAWPYQNRGEVQREAIATRSAASASPQFRSEAIEAHLLRIAEALRRFGSAPEPEARLQELISRAESLDFESMEAALDELESDVCQAIAEAMQAGELEELGLHAGKVVAEYRGRVPAAQLLEMQQQWKNRRMLQLRGIPRMSMFYMQGGAA